MMTSSKDRVTQPSRRTALKIPLAAAALGLLRGTASALDRRDALHEHSPANLKLAIKVTVPGLADEELLFLKQIGLRWVHADFGPRATL